MDRCPDDNAFGPVLETGSCYSFDFTLLFEESFFSIAPCAIVLPLTAARLRQLWSRPVLIYRDYSERGAATVNQPAVLGLKLVGSPRISHRIVLTLHRGRMQSRPFSSSPCCHCGPQGGGQKRTQHLQLPLSPFSRPSSLPFCLHLSTAEIYAHPS